MKKKVIVVLVCVLFLASVFPMISIAEKSDGPEFEDKLRDVLLFGLFRVIPQSKFKHIDIVSAWFSEDSSSPEYLHISLELRDLEESTELLEAIYVVSWLNNNNYFLVGLHVYPSGVSDYYFGVSMDEDSNIDNYDYCDGTYNSDDNIITWTVPKERIGNIRPGNILYDIHPHTHLRFTYESGLPMFDLLKDLPGNAKIVNDYIVQY